MRCTPDRHAILNRKTWVANWGRPPLSGYAPPPSDKLRRIFRGREQGGCGFYETATPGGCGRRSVICANQPLAAKISAIEATSCPTDSYENDPEAYERRVHLLFADIAPELMAAMARAKSRDAIIVEAHGLPLSGPIPVTPLDGVVNERRVRSQLLNLIGVVAGRWGLSGFTYFSENDNKLLRAVCLLKQYASTASSQGYQANLVWHQNNANRAIPWMPDPHPAKRGPMNAFQAFVAIRPIVPPMKVIALADIIHQAARSFGPGLIEQLMQDNFAVNKPESH